MTKVSISVESSEGDVTIAHAEIATKWPTPTADERQRINGLLRRALAQVDQAYGLSQKQAAEALKPVGGAE